LRRKKRCGDIAIEKNSGGLIKWLLGADSQAEIGEEGDG
jgi:hypothetical protein